MEDIKKLLKTIETDFINVVKITQVGEVDYVLHLFNTYSGKRWVFRIYKALFDKGMEIRRKIKIEIETSEDNENKVVKENGAELFI